MSEWWFTKSTYLFHQQNTAWVLNLDREKSGSFRIWSAQRLRPSILQNISWLFFFFNEWNPIWLSPAVGRDVDWIDWTATDFGEEEKLNFNVWWIYISYQMPKLQGWESGEKSKALFSCFISVRKRNSPDLFFLRSFWSVGMGTGSCTYQNHSFDPYAPARFALCFQSSLQISIEEK